MGALNNEESHAELWDHYDDDDEDDHRRDTSTHKCKFCQQGGLHWEDDNGKWRLVHPTGLIHKCAGNTSLKGPIKRI